MGIAPFLVTCLVASLALSAQAQAETGYVFKADLNADGVEDRIESGPRALFGNAGGPYVVTLSQPQKKTRKFVITLGWMNAIELTATRGRLWTYWRYGAGDGGLSAYTLTNDLPSDAKEIPQEGITLNGNSALDTAILQLVFAPQRKIEFRKVENYTPPPNPSGLEWGK